jgi:superfamily II DNA or RNA helicase
MCLKDIKLKKAYSSDFDNILFDFYIPVLSHSVGYNRLAGFFSSSSLAIAARGISKLIKNNGIMRLVVSPKLRKDDLDTILLAHKEPEKLIEEKMLNELEKMEDEFIKNHVYALGWMVANGRLEIKVAMICDEHGNPLSYEEGEKSGIFHQKVGILKDVEGNIVTFSGSINESAAGWLGNIEEFKVFRSWDTSEQEYVEADILKFNTFWNNLSGRVKVMKIPEAVEKKLIELAPKDVEELDLEKGYPMVSRRRGKITLYEHQKEAVKSWVKNGMRGIFEMATGTGKTFAALECLEKVLEEREELITVVACPYDHLVKQWLDDIKIFGISSEVIIADSSNPSWKNKMVDSILDIKNGINDTLIVETTHATFSTDDFVNIIKTVNEEILLIVDEVHGIGAPKRKEGLIDSYTFRLGLSATPKRWFDIEGTEKIFDYFGDTVFEFSLKEAINTINPSTGETYLTPYEYKPYFVELTDEELWRYEKETEKIAKTYQKTKDEGKREELFSLLCIKRQNIIKNAINKYEAFREIIEDIGQIEHCLIYCSPEQINTVQDILNEKGIIQHKFTLHEGTLPEEKYGGLSEREFLLRKFAEGTYQALVAMRCLDEGVDVPPAKIAVILASSGNPREYIQRRGRVLRHFPGKERAVIYDILVVPTLSKSINPYLMNIERRILGKEFKRYKEFAYIATNTLDCLNKIEDIERRYSLVV